MIRGLLKFGRHARDLWKGPEIEYSVLMHKKSKRPRYLFLYVLVVLACVGLWAAISHNRARRLQIENAHPKAPEPETPSQPVKKVSTESLETTIATQKMSLRVEAPVELEDPLEANSLQAHKSLLLSARPEQTPSQIIGSDPKAFVEEARKSLDYTPPTNAIPVLETASAEKIVTDE